MPENEAVVIQTSHHCCSLERTTVVWFPSQRKAATSSERGNFFYELDTYIFFKYGALYKSFPVCCCTRHIETGWWTRSNKRGVALVHHQNPEQITVNFTICSGGCGSSVVEFNYRGELYGILEKRTAMILLRYNLSWAAFVSSQHGRSVSSERAHHPPQPQGRLTWAPAVRPHWHLCTRSCGCTQSSSALSPCTGTEVHFNHTVLNEKQACRLVKIFLAVLLVVCLQRAG